MSNVYVNKIPRICYLGPFDPDYPRNRVILKGLRKNGVEVIECNYTSSSRILDYARLIKKHFLLKCDAVILGARGDYYGQPLVPIIKKLTKKPVIFDSVIALYETQVLDRKLFDVRTFQSSLLHMLDYKALHAADMVLCDTNNHADYYSHFYKINPQKIRKISISSDNEVFYPREYSRNDDSILVLFWGGFIPLQGVKYIIEAAKLLEHHKDLKFELRGFGQTYDNACKLCRKLNVNNLTIVPRFVPYDELPFHIAKADICLGIFGETEKAKRVIPNKAVEALAMKKPLITGDSPAIREIFTNNKDCLLVPMANPKAIADAIIALKQDKLLSNSIAENGYSLFNKTLSPEVIGKDLKSILIRLIEDPN